MATLEQLAAAASQTLGPDEARRLARTGGVAAVSSAVSARAAASAGGTSLLPDLGGLAAGVQAGIDEAHTQEEFFASITRWGTVALVALVVLVLAVIAAYFLAPVRTAAAGLLSAAT